MILKLLKVLTFKDANVIYFLAISMCIDQLNKFLTNGIF